MKSIFRMAAVLAVLAGLCMRDNEEIVKITSESMAKTYGGGREEPKRMMANYSWEEQGKKQAKQLLRWRAR